MRQGKGDQKDKGQGAMIQGKLWGQEGYDIGRIGKMGWAGSATDLLVVMATKDYNVNIACTPVLLRYSFVCVFLSVFCICTSKV